jgi:hypothetical protein
MSRKKNRGLVVIERGGGAGGLLWLLVGGMVGAGLGLLLAPHSGKKTRALLGERLASLKAQAEEAFDELTEEGQSLLEADEEEGGPSPSPATGKDDDVDDDGAPAEEEEPRRKRPTARAELEQRLARARARRHRELAEEDEEPVA